jgi:hypothetical protein
MFPDLEGSPSLPLKQAAVVLCALLLMGGVRAAEPPAPSPNDVDNASYPKTLQTAQGSVVVHTPQITQWRQFRELEGWLALEVTPVGSKNPAIGAVSFAAHSRVDLVRRTVQLSEIRVVELVFPDAAQQEQLAGIARAALSTKPKTVPLDVILRGLPDEMVAQIRERVSVTPPRIHVATSPTALMLIRGDPALQPIDGTELAFVANTDWHLFYHHKKKRWYVLNGQSWQESKSLDKPWRTVTRLPDDFSRLPDNEYWEVVRRKIPAPPQSAEPPTLLVSQTPAVLVVIDGEPELQVMAQAGLQFVDNTPSDLFMSQGQYYLLIANLWFVSPTLDGEWQLVSSLPENFAYISPGHRKGHVLAFVPGTQEAKVLSLERQIPRKVRVEKGVAKELVLTYTGQPQFAPIHGTRLRRAVNTSFQVIQVAERFYLCLDAAWFESDNPIDGWSVSHGIPEEIYRIPVEDPTHNTTYVRLWNEDPGLAVVDTVIYAHTAAYTQPLDVDVEYQRHGGYLPADAWGLYPGYGYWGRSPGFFMYPHTQKYGSTYNPETGTTVQQSLAYSADGRQRSMSVSVNFGKRQKTQVDRSLEGIETAKQQLPDDMYADADGGVYRRTEGGWQRHEAGGWQDTGPDLFDNDLDRWWQARTRGLEDFDCQQRSCAGETGG